MPLSSYKVGEAPWEKQSFPVGQAPWEAQQQSVQQGQPQGSTGLGGFAEGIAQQQIKTLHGLSNFGGAVADQTFGRLVNLVSGKGFTPTQSEDPFAKLAGGQGNLDKLTTPTTGAQSTGQLTEQIAEFLMPSSKILNVEKGLTGLVKGVGLAQSAAKLGIRSAVSGGTTGAISAVQNQGQVDDNVKTNAIIGALFPVAGKILGKGLEVAGGGFKAIGQKIQQSVIKPSLADVRDGFKVENLNKYKLGGSLQSTLAKTNNVMNDLSTQLKSKLADSHIGVNLNNAVENTVKRLTGNKVTNFGDNTAITRVLNNLQDEVLNVAGKNGLVDLVDANVIKRGAGTKGSWVFGNPDPDARAVEKVYNTFYNELKTSIENAANQSGQTGIKEINKQISELIPINNAVLRRIPVAERNNALGLGDLISLTGSILDPKALLLTGVNRLSKSAQVGNLLVKAGEAIKNPSGGNSVKQRFFGNYANQSEANTKYIKQSIPNNAIPNTPPKVSPNAIPPKTNNPLSIGNSIPKNRGFIKGADGGNVLKIHPEDKRVMKDFTDYVGKNMGKMTERQIHELEFQASQIAEHYNIKNFKTLKGLSHEFGRILEDQGLDFGKIAGNPLVIGAGASAGAVALAKLLKKKK